MATLNIILQVVAFDDPNTGSNNPARRAADWTRRIVGAQVLRPQTESFTLDPQEEVTVFSGTRTLATASNTELELSLSPLASTRYRLAWVATGTAPAFRTARTVVVTAGTMTLVANANLTMTVTSSLGSPFGAVVVGDTVLIPGTSTGDSASPFDPLNEGEWTVLAATSATLTLSRPTGVSFSGAGETATISSNSEFQVFSAAGVQVGDTLDISAGFAVTARHAYEIVAVTASHVEFTSTAPLAEETAVPTATGIKVYSASKTFVYLESDQEIAVKLNADTSENTRVEPVVAGDPSMVGIFAKQGLAYSVVLKNRSTAPANITFISAE